MLSYTSSFFTKYRAPTMAHAKPRTRRHTAADVVAFALSGPFERPSGATASRRLASMRREGDGELEDREEEDPEEEDPEEKYQEEEDREEEDKENGEEQETAGEDHESQS